MGEMTGPLVAPRGEILSRGVRMVARVSAEQSFWSRVEKTDGCWMWRGKIKRTKHSGDGGGYGVLQIPGTRQSITAHRQSYILAYGCIPDGAQVCHHCDVRACVRPEHLFIGTAKDNMSDAARKGRFPGKLNPDQVREIKRRLARGERAHLIAKEYGVFRAAIYSIQNGRSYAYEV